MRSNPLICRAINGRKLNSIQRLLLDLNQVNSMANRRPLQ